ncbi:hypothetical protein AU255_04755 [Methyloprofundus sedimenti]|uniref:Uncharacterized protein n=1 Tax=Methyloprofundus sedimenti TaxID=1420851 RepID=A0A1V8M6S9_9GAMM|nr:type II secretion system protein [Methyloprofundus sedimenti]OQK17206.1 hypothetical protein AU255_04755 [Methyloprofundus sedimenti]
MNSICIKQSGFTLVELLVVMMVLVAMASITIETTSELAFQSRYEVTKDRYEKIRRAIIGRPDVLINGQPNISGFVKDMGRLPFKIHDLLEEDYCLTDPTKDSQATCGASWRNQTAYVPHTATSQGYGWNGPYINIDSPKALADGWGTGSDTITVNHGWNFSNTSDTITLNSYGKNGVSGGTDTFDKDYPGTDHLAIDSNSWKVDVTGIQINTSAAVLSGAGTCSALPFDSDLVACEMAGGHWDGTCDPTTTYTTRYQCEVIYGEDWIPTSHCGGTLVTPDTKVSCEGLGGTWATDNTDIDICVKIYYVSSTDAASGDIITINNPIVSGPKTLPRDGFTHQLSFDGFNDASGPNSTIPIGQISLSVNEFDASASPSCTDTVHNSGSAVLVSVFKGSLLPVINW